MTAISIPDAFGKAAVERRKILVMGLPGGGKAALAEGLARHLGAVRFNAEAVRDNIDGAPASSRKDPIEQARRLGWLCDRVIEAGGFAVADFVCPTPETRAAFGEAFIVWVDRIPQSRLADTDRLFVPPARCDMRVTATGAPEDWAEEIARHLRPVFDPQRPTALFVGRWQPFHDGHRALIERELARTGQVCIAVRADDDLDSLPFEAVKDLIEAALRRHAGRFTVVPLPNVTHIFHGGDRDCAIELSEEIPASAVRRSLLPAAPAFHSPQ